MTVMTRMGILLWALILSACAAPAPDTGALR